ncbi:MAG: hypothetical protein PHQ12_11945 [Chthoniobacteraceae bacterium]|nr:hypothetical protein [Chthoniobacteraceae bacterium]
MKYKSKPIPVKLDEPLLERIAAMSERMGEAQSTVMRIAMRIGLEHLEEAVKKKRGTVQLPVNDSRSEMNERNK